MCQFVCLCHQISRATSALSWRSAHSNFDEDGVSDGDWQSADLDRYVLQSFVLHPAVKTTATSALEAAMRCMQLSRPSCCQQVFAARTLTIRTGLPQVEQPRRRQRRRPAARCQPALQPEPQQPRPRRCAERREWGALPAAAIRQQPPQRQQPRDADSSGGRWHQPRKQPEPKGAAQGLGSGGGLAGLPGTWQKN